MRECQHQLKQTLKPNIIVGPTIKVGFLCWDLMVKLFGKIEIYDDEVPMQAKQNCTYK